MRSRPLILLPLLLAGCGGSGGGSSAVKGIAVGPTSSTLKPGGIQIFTATLNGGYKPVTWSVVETGGGTIDGGGRYVAPNRSGTYTVRAALKSDPATAATTTVKVDSGYTVSGTNPTVIGAGRTKAFSATVLGATDATVTWSASAGTITPAGAFTAPTTLGDVTVTATSVADPGKSKAYTVRVAAPVEIVVPSAGTLTLPRARLTFSGLVDGEAAAVDWSASGGSVDANGKWIAPDAPGTYTITAARKDDASATASVQVETVAAADAKIVVADKGEVLLRLRADEAPNTTANFASLINESFYDGIIFHRYEPGFVIQGGDPFTKTKPLNDPSIGTGGPGYTIPFEANPLLHTKYALAMARSSDRDSAGSQFYITLEAQPTLDGNYVVFGEVESGTDVVDALRRGDRIVSIRLQRH